jgi:hypothetical protein
MKYRTVHLLVLCKFLTLAVSLSLKTRNMSCCSPNSLLSTSPLESYATSLRAPQETDEVFFAYFRDISRVTWKISAPFQKQYWFAFRFVAEPLIKTHKQQTDATSSVEKNKEIQVRSASGNTLVTSKKRAYKTSCQTTKHWERITQEMYSKKIAWDRFLWRQQFARLPRDAITESSEWCGLPVERRSHQQRFATAACPFLISVMATCEAS